MIGRLVTVSEIADPFKTNNIRGRISASARVRQSRTICVSSLRVCASMRLICNPMNSHRSTEAQRQKDARTGRQQERSLLCLSVALSLCLCGSVANSLQASILGRDFAFQPSLFDDADKDVFHRESPGPRLE